VTASWEFPVLNLMLEYGLIARGKQGGRPAALVNGRLLCVELYSLSIA